MNNVLVNQRLSNISLQEQCIPPEANYLNMSLSPLKTSSPKNKMIGSKHILSQADDNYDAKISKNMSENLLKGDEHSNYLRPMSSV